MESIEINLDEVLGPLNQTERKHAPAKIYAGGDVELLRSFARVSIVGSRKASPQGLARARRIAKLLAERQIVVVSGLAEGIDTAAHTAAIEAGGRTIGVLGTGLDQCFPRSNSELQQLMMREHLVISQFEPGSTTQMWHFPLRNRLMALISNATVIVEASEQSGTQSQGWEALRLGRSLFILESVASRSDLSWPQKMISYGARCLSDSNLDDFFEVLPTPLVEETAGGIPF
jgi:DNA processing protein